MTSADLDRLRDIDGTIESSRYLHLDRTGEGVLVSFRLEERMLREKRIDPNGLGDDAGFVLKQVVSGADEGVALWAEHEGEAVGLALAQPQPTQRILRLVDLRVDYEYRRQGLGTAMACQVIREAKQLGVRAVLAETRADNYPANMFLAKCGFDLAGLDTQRHSNHDMVKECATLIWYVTLD